MFKLKYLYFIFYYNIQVLSVTFVRIFLSPLKDIGAAISEFLVALLIDLPPVYYPIALVMVIIVVFLILIMGMGYSIRLPFFFSIEPGQPVLNDPGSREAIEAGNRQMAEQVRSS